MNAHLAAVVALSPLTLAACATAPLGEAEAISTRIARDLGASPLWARDEAATAAARARVATLLAGPVSADTAVQIALINNPRVTAAFESLGIARADFLDAVTPPAPSLHFLELNSGDGHSSALTYGAGLDLLALLSLPASVRAGDGAWEAARARAVGELLEVAAGARASWIDYARARQTADLTTQAAQAAASSAAAADALLAAGNIAQVERDREALYAAEIGIANVQAQAGLVPAREHLIAALGLRPDQANLLQDLERLPAPPEAPIAIPDLEVRVAAASTDLAVATGILEAARAETSVSWLTSLLPGLGLEAEREREDGEWKEGLGVSWILPIFDLGGADRLRRASEARRAAALAEALQLEIRSEARVRLAQAEAARQIALTRRALILPLSADVFDGAVRDFNAMEIGILQLLQERRARLDAGREAISAVADYWHAQARLDLLLAGDRTDGPAEAPQSSSDARAADPGH